MSLVYVHMLEVAKQQVCIYGCVLYVTYIQSTEITVLSA